jgi:hypothetical protein
MTPIQEEPPEAAALGLLLSVAARQIVKLDDPARFLDWFAGAAPDLAPEFIAAFPPQPELRRAALRAIGRLIWNRTPLPEHGFRPRPLPEPERNAPCPCGSESTSTAAGNWSRGSRSSRPSVCWATC